MAKQRGPVRAATVANLVGHIRWVLAESAFQREGYRTDNSGHSGRIRKFVWPTAPIIDVEARDSPGRVYRAPGSFVTTWDSPPFGVRSELTIGIPGHCLASRAVSPGLSPTRSHCFDRIGRGSAFGNRLESAVGSFVGRRNSCVEFNSSHDNMAFLDFKPFEQRTDRFQKSNDRYWLRLSVSF